MTGRRLDIRWAEGRTVPAILEGPSDAAVGVLLAHGAGAGQQHPFMEGIRARLASAGMAVLAFDYPYIAEGRKAPDRQPTLVACHQAAADELARRVDTVVFAGKSMGGRVGSHVEGHERCARIFYGYPLVAIGKAEPRDTAHLDAITGPMLFVQGERDRLAPLEMIASVVDRLGATLEVIADGDHSYRVPKRSGMSDEEILDRITALTVGWMGEHGLA